jgi:DNA-binding transcriptional LysR family regulator
MYNMQDIEPSWQALHLLAAMNEEQGLVRAAQRLAMSQSAASHSIRKLEQTLGVALVSRGRNGLRLSEAALRILPHVNRALHSLEAMREEISHLAGVQRGVLRVAAVPSLAGSWVPRLISEFHARYPLVEVSLFEGTDNEIAEWVSNRVAHVGFAALPVDGLSTIEVARDEWMAVLPKTDQAVRVTLGSLAKRKFLLSGGGCEVHICRLFNEAGFDLPASRFTVKQVSTIEAMVSEGLGVSLAPATALSGSKKIRLVPLSPRRFRSLGLLLPADASPSVVVTAWTGTVRDHFGLVAQK